MNIEIIDLTVASFITPKLLLGVMWLRTDLMSIFKRTV
jgi:hypothetical protein